VETKGMGESRRRGFKASEDRRCFQARCPACFIIRDTMPKEFTCNLTRCPRKFVANIEPLSGGLQLAGARDEPF
jgi:hypothetical protein